MRVPPSTKSSLIFPEPKGMSFAELIDHHYLYYLIKINTSTNPVPFVYNIQRDMKKDQRVFVDLSWTMNAAKTLTGAGICNITSKPAPFQPPSENPFNTIVEKS